MKRKQGEMKDGELTLIAGLIDARDNERGRRKLASRRTEVKPLKQLTGRDIRAMRDKLGLTQREFAMRLNVAMGSIAQWETSTKQPKGAALKLLHIAKKHLQLFADPDE